MQSCFTLSQLNRSADDLTARIGVALSCAEVIL